VLLYHLNKIFVRFQNHLHHILLITKRFDEV
jgi:hypothetical protein